MPSTHCASTPHHGSQISPTVKTFCLASTVRRYQPPPTIRYAFLRPPIEEPINRLPVSEYNLPLTFDRPSWLMMLRWTGSPSNMNSVFSFTWDIRLGPPPTTKL